MAGPEYQPRGHEANTEQLERAAAERSAELAKKHERSGESLDDSELRHSAERARAEASKEALFSKEYSTGEKKHDNAESSPTVVTKQQREQSYKQTMNRVQKEMTPAARTFSKVIHTPVIERTSEVIGSTIARPNAILSGSICAFLAVLGLYALARHYGFALSGFETIGAFALGWLVGITFDFLKVMITGKR